MKRTRLLIAACLLGAVSAHADEMTLTVQKKLVARGFYSGEVDGEMGSQTAAAIRRYQLAEGLRVTGQLDSATLKSLAMPLPKPAPSPKPTPSRRLVAPPPARAESSPATPQYVAIASIFKGGPYITYQTEFQIATIRQAQRNLRLLGYFHGPADGAATAALVSSIKAWQKSAGFRQTGRFDESTLKGLNLMPYEMIPHE